MAASSASDYVYDSFIDSPDKQPQEIALEKLNKFVLDFAGQLRDIENALDESFSEVWDAVRDPISADIEIFSKCEYMDLINTDNRFLRKILLVFTSLSKEMHDLKQIATEKFYAPLVMFGEREDPEDAPEGEAQLHFARVLHLLQEIWSFVDRVSIVVQNAVRQMASLYATPLKGQRERDIHLKAFDRVHFQGFFASLGDLLGVLITLDEIIVQNGAFANSLSIFKRMLRSVKTDPARFGSDEASVRKFEMLLQHVEGDLLDGLIFQNCVERNFEERSNGIEVKTNKRLQEEFDHNLKAYFAHLSPRLGMEAPSSASAIAASVSVTGADSGDKRSSFVGFCGLYVLYFALFRDPSDKKFFKQVWDVQKRLPIVHLSGNIVFSPGDFLSRKVPTMVKTLGLKDINRDIAECRRDYNRSLDEAFQGQVQMLHLTLCNWMVRMESSFTVESDGKDLVIIQQKLLLAGLQLSNQISQLLKTTMFLHMSLDAPTTAKHALAMCKCVEMLKSIEFTIRRKSATVTQYMPTVLQFLSTRIQRMLLPVRSRLEAVRNPDDAQIDQLSAVSLVLKLLQNTLMTPQRFMVIRLSLSVALQKLSGGLMKDSDVDEMKLQLRRLEDLATFSSLLKEHCDCSFLFFSRPIVHAFFKTVFDNPSQQASKLQYMFAALRDCVPFISSSVHLANDNNNKKLLESFKAELMQSLNEQIIDPLCRAIENDLRLHIHSVVLGQHSVRKELRASSSSSSSSTPAAMKDLARFLQIRPIRFQLSTADDIEYLDIKTMVTHYLDTTFYNLTTIAIHDWKTYEEMRNLALEKYGLQLANVHLPNQTLEQGLDVLEITRNIHSFVARYCYNMNTQTFVERATATSSSGGPASSDPGAITGKNLNTIHIRHIANSIRTHGTGIMNTTVNFVYQFLGRKFFVFSQFLYDDHIKSRLMKDIRVFKEERESLQNKFPMKRAEKFVKDIRKLGSVGGSGSGSSAADMMSYLDQFRVLITEIGNALGYVRMVRSGGLRYISNAIKFVPDLHHIVEFQQLVSEENLSAETIEAGRNLDGCIKNLSDKLASGSDYFSILVEILGEELLKEQNQHLKNFHIIIPALTLSYVEAMLVAKDKLMKKGKEGNFTEDGFALGVAFILQVLNQNQPFDSLHWFESVEQHFDEEEAKMKEQMAQARKRSPEEMQTMQLSVNKITVYRMEFELLFCSFASARIFFRD